MDITYDIIYSKRKHITLSVERDRSVVVRAPIGTSEEAIRQAVEARKLWLYEKLRHQQKYPEHPDHKEFVTGETLFYLGQPYSLELTDDLEPDVRFDARFYISHHYRRDAAQLMQAWYTTRAQTLIPPKAKAFAQALGVHFNQVLVSDMKLQWASCTPQNNLNFNWRIMQAPIFVIDYLIVHELTHLLEPNHTATFWNIVAVQVPRYEEAKAWLRENGNVLEEEF